mgnify:CR=1 FL=1
MLDHLNLNFLVFREIDFIVDSIDLAPIKVAGILDNEPIKDPIGVLFASTITTLLNDINPIFYLPWRLQQIYFHI